jgi:hypothetical protein
MVVVIAAPQPGAQSEAAQDEQRDNEDSSEDQKNAAADKDARSRFVPGRRRSARS